MTVSAPATPAPAAPTGPRLYFSRSTLGFYNSSINPSWPGDSVAITQDTHDAMMLAQSQGATIAADASGQPIAVPYVPSQAAVIQGFATALQTALDAQAKSWQYDSMLSASTYVTSTIAKYAAEAKALVSWRDAAWNAADMLLASVQAGKTPAPATNAAFLTAVLPTAPTRPTGA
jgi:hypothetical protein